MSKDLIHEKFVGAIREKIPHKATLTHWLIYCAWKKKLFIAV